MQYVEPYSTPTRIPRFPTECVWINAAVSTNPDDLRGHVLLFDLWDYTCINCLRTLPYLRAWYARYQHLDFKLIGIHTPEFPFAKDIENVRRAANRLGIRWPIVLDNDQSIWTAFANRYWPTKYLADRNGYLRYRHTGEGGYAVLENALQELLKEGQGELDLPEILDPVREEDRPGAICLPATPELQADSLGNPKQSPQDESSYSLPASFQQGKYYLEGKWDPVAHGFKLKSKTGCIVLNYKASRCNAVLAISSGSNPHSPEASGFIPVWIKQDDVPLPAENFAEDVLSTDGQALLRVGMPRMYAITRLPSVEPHTITLEIFMPGLVFYAFSFESCASIQNSSQSNVEV